MSLQTLAITFSVHLTQYLSRHLHRKVATVSCISLHAHTESRQICVNALKTCLDLPNLPVIQENSP